MEVLIVRNQERPEATEAAFSLCAYLDSLGYGYQLLDGTRFLGVEARVRVRESLEKQPDLAVVLGGDGTIIRTASVLRSTCPLLGINFGHLGFLANDSHEGVIDLVSRALCGELDQSRRTCLEATFEDDDGEALGSCYAVNEVAITRGASGTSLEFSFDVSGVPMAHLKGDGLIVATATGSTGYSMAAGGPLVTPGFSGMVVQPLAPHTLMSRALLADSNDVVEVRLTREEDREAAMFLIDGDALSMEEPVAAVRVQRSAESITLLYAKQDHFLTYSAEKFYDV